MFRSPHDEFDPVARSYRQFRRKFRSLLMGALAVGLTCVFYGVPSIQGNYRAYQTNGTPTATDKINAEYWNPFGRHHVEAGEYAIGCPIVVFIPLRECVDLRPYRNTVTLLLFGKEFFDGPSS